MRTVWRVAGVAVHLLLVVAAMVGVLVATAHPAYPPLRVALVVLVGVLCAVTLFARFPLGLGPVAESAIARVVRSVGVALAGAGATGAVLGLAQGGSSFERASTGVPLYTVVLAAYLGAFLAVTRRDSGLPPRGALISVGLGLLAAGLFAAAVPALPPAVRWLAFLLIAAAGAGAARLTRPAESRPTAALLAAITACQAIFFAAAVLYQYGPDAWMPYAGPGPLTPQAQLEQNRAEAIDPYVGVLFIGLLAAIVLIGAALSEWRRARTAAAPTALRAV
ncbi:hypothetical protein [Paractinoplanes globisporus]|uniref:Uncharacterized protein n=1 Tax=Paractinoplanes globisporus TaxID=113565 RepID=A0ABW6W7D5_9ACTN|nr:hypothetical protein [Actinoplanes globisporus]